MTVSDDLKSLRRDDQRDSYPFETAFSNASYELIRAETDEVRASILSGWLKKYQPCIFGRIAAERELITYCFLTDKDLTMSDSEIRKKIQRRRLAWKSLALDGRRSAFVILAVSEELMLASPDESLKSLACRIAHLYLDKEISPDEIYSDTLRLWDLEFNSRRRWAVGVNFFAAQGDRRWWNDHRIPGGIGFSMNSTGHLVASEARRSAIRDAALAISKPGRGGKLKEAEAELVSLQATSVRTLDHALRYAMHTIRNASVNDGSQGDCPWEPATRLVKTDPGDVCPIKLIEEDSQLKGFDWDSYIGWYHTDVTVPSEYFEFDFARPVSLTHPYRLDFSYLHTGRGSDFRRFSKGQSV